MVWCIFLCKLFAPGKMLLPFLKTVAVAEASDVKPARVPLAAAVRMALVGLSTLLPVWFIYQINLDLNMMDRDYVY